MAQIEGQAVVIQPTLARRTTSRLTRLGRLARKKPLGTVAALVLLLLVFTAAAAPLIAPYDPLETHKGDALLGPSKTYLMGSDGSGRDVLSRLIYGARTSVFIALITVSIAIAIAFNIGLFTGYFGGPVDLIGQRLIDAKMSIPGLVLAMSIVAVMGQSIFNLILAMTIILVGLSSRVIRGAVLTTKENIYVEAARAIGCGNLRIMYRHVAPQVVAPAIIMASLQLGFVIVYEASLSFLGLGIPPPTPSWGGMLDSSVRAYLLHTPLQSVWPGLAITIVVLSFHLFGDALRDTLDPRLRSG